MHKGKIKFFDDSKGIGIVKAAEGREFFVHYKDFTFEGYLTIEPGKKVEFETAPYKKGGFKAVNVKIVE